MKNLIVIPTGYMGSGSSAVTDIISEFDGFQNNLGAFEYIFMHCPDGLFDLEDKLLRGNTALRSDEAIHRFLAYMKKLYGPGYWFSGYREKISPSFMDWCRELTDELCVARFDDTFWYFQDDFSTLSKRLRCYIRYLVSLPFGGRHPDGQPVHPLDYRGVSIAYPTPEDFYAAARRLLDKIFRALGRDEHHLVLDQLLLPHSLFRLDRYFDENVRVFVVERDPRDVFLLNKYYWAKDLNPIPCPLEAEEFCRAYAGLRRIETPVDDPRVIRLHFEDLIYRFDETLERVCRFLGTSDAQHTRKGTLFVPERSVNNTQLFRKKPEFAEEAELIAARLPEYLYDFPADTSAWRETEVF